MIKNIFVFFIILLFSNISFSGEFKYLYRSPKGLLMGDAYTTITDKTHALYYNPATLGRDIGFYPRIINFKLGLGPSNLESEEFEDLPEDAPSIAGKVMGIPLHFDLGAAPMVQIGPFALSYLVTQSYDLLLSNSSHPILDIDYRYDRAGYLSYIHTWSKGRKIKKKGRKVILGNGYVTSLGLSGKVITRSGLEGRFDLFGTELLTIINSGTSDYKQIRNALGYSKGQGWGIDIGFDHVRYYRNTQIAFGISALDIGDTNIRKREGNLKIPRQDMSINAGISFKQDFGLYSHTLSFDLHPINQPIDEMRKIHAGIEIQIAFASLLAGYNGGYSSIGFELDFGFTKIYGGWYGIEVGNSFNQLESQRYVYGMDLLSFDFGSKDF